MWLEGIEPSAKLGVIINEETGIDMDGNFIEVDPELEPRFKKIKDLPGGTQLFEYSHVPHLAAMAPGMKTIVIIGKAFSIFNESALEHLKQAKTGDLIQVTVDLNHEVWSAWKPAEDYIPAAGFHKLARARFVGADPNGCPFIIGDFAI